MNSITVNGVEISEQAILAEMQNHPAPKAEDAIAAAARALAVRELLLQEARTRGLNGQADGDETPDEAAIRQLIEHEITLPKADDETCRRYFDNNRQRFRSPEAFDAQHILYAAPPDDPEIRAAAGLRAKAALARILAEPAQFEALATAESSCPSRASGGRLGPVQRGGVDEVFETYLMSLGEGETCPVPVETKYGFHVIRLVARIPGRDLPYDSVKDQIAAFLEESVWRRAVHQYVSILAGRAELHGIDLAGAASPLVQ